MSQSLFFSNTTLQSILWPKQNHLFKQCLLVLGGAFFLGLASQLSIPLIPVPLTFQSCTAILIAMILGARLGSLVIMAYLALGCIGIPVFANLSGGLHVLTGPSGGYLIGFLPAAFICGILAQLGFAKNRLLTFVAALLGTMIIFIFGYVFLAQFTGWHKAYQLGIQPFLISEPLKLIAVAIIIPWFWKKYNSPSLEKNNARF